MNKQRQSLLLSQEISTSQLPLTRFNLTTSATLLGNRVTLFPLPASSPSNATKSYISFVQKSCNKNISFSYLLQLKKKKKNCFTCRVLRKGRVLFTAVRSCELHRLYRFDPFTFLCLLLCFVVWIVFQLKIKTIGVNVLKRLFSQICECSSSLIKIVQIEKNNDPLLALRVPAYQY